MPTDNLSHTSFTPEQKSFYSDLVQVITKHSKKISATEMMALLSQEIGIMKGMHDSKQYDKETTMDCINKNIELGARTYVVMNCGAKGSA